jgi:autotransporter-associated beta strand protein
VSETPGQTFSIGFRYDVGHDLTSNSGGTLTLDGPGDGVLDYGLPGTGGLVKTGAGTWTLTGTNTFTGGTTVLNGTLVLANNEAIAAGTSLTVGDPSVFAMAIEASSMIPAAVPEPGTLVLLAAVLGSLMIYRRTQRMPRRR